jgi:hypothetical protein
MRTKKKQSKKLRSRSVSHSVFVALPDALSNNILDDLKEIEKIMENRIFGFGFKENGKRVKKVSKRRQ